jgi:hypothetical protein
LPEPRFCLFHHWGNPFSQRIYAFPTVWNQDLQDFRIFRIVRNEFAGMFAHPANLVNPENHGSDNKQPKHHLYNRRNAMKISKIYTHNLRNDAHFQFHTEFKEPETEKGEIDG